MIDEVTIDIDEEPTNEEQKAEMMQELLETKETMKLQAEAEKKE